MKKFITSAGRTPFLSFIIVSSIVFSSCNIGDLSSSNFSWDNYNVTIPGVYYDTLLMNTEKYLSMQTGQHYHYKDSVTGQIDSITVSFGGERYEYDTIYIIQLDKASQSGESWFRGSLFRVGQDSLMRMNTNTGTAFEFYKNPAQNKVHSSMTFYSMMYSDVLECSFTNNITKTTTTTFWVPNVGLVKMVTETATERKVITLAEHW